jgi:hypothetical protein
LLRGFKAPAAPAATAEEGIPLITGDPSSDVEPEPEVQPRLVAVQPGDPEYLTADTLLQHTWAKKDAYALVGMVAVHRVENPRLASAYEAYKASISRGEIVNGNEVLVFHGCSESTITLGAPDNMLEHGFLKKYWKTSAGAWQRFGPGFYFGQQASKSHEYPLPEYCPRKGTLSRGEHTRKMLLCKVAMGKVHKTSTDMATLKGAAPTGFDSVHGEATKAGALNYDELVVYREEAVLPFAVVEYRFRKH